MPDRDAEIQEAYNTEYDQTHGAQLIDTQLTTWFDNELAGYDIRSIRDLGRHII